MIAFIDVSGDPYALPEKSPWIVLNIVCIQKDYIYEITNKFHSLKRDILANEAIEIKSTDLVNKHTLSHPVLEKYRFLDRVVYECLDHPGCKHASIAFKNTGQNRRNNQGQTLPKHYQSALWKIESIARNWDGAKDAIVVIDNHAVRNVDRRLAFAFNNFLYRSKYSDELNHILPVPIFADSEMTPGIQLADIAAGIVRVHHIHNDETKANRDVWLNKIEEYYSTLLRRSLNAHIHGNTEYGFYVAKKEYLLYPAQDP